MLDHRANFMAKIRFGRKMTDLAEERWWENDRFVEIKPICEFG